MILGARFAFTRSDAIQKLAEMIDDDVRGLKWPRCASKWSMHPGDAHCQRLTVVSKPNLHNGSSLTTAMCDCGNQP
jgi:hypothetical protein